MSEKTTPRPWKVDGELIADGRAFQIAAVETVDYDEMGVVIPWEECQANARLIVQAVNAHDDLVAACAAALALLLGGENFEGHKSYVAGKLEAAIRKAKHQDYKVCNEPRKVRKLKHEGYKVRELNRCDKIRKVR